MAQQQDGEQAPAPAEAGEAARESHDTGRRVPLRSTFRWPVVA